MRSYEEIEKLIVEKRAEAIRSGPMHRRDTERFIKRLQRERKMLSQRDRAARKKL